MTLRHLEPLLWSALLSGVGTAIWLAATPLRPSAPPSPRSAPSAFAVAGGAYPADSLARAVVAANLFRLDRRPSAVRYDPHADQAGPAFAPSKPRLILRGLLRGDTARALIEGFPGMDGSRLVKAGESVSGLRVVAIAGGQVRVVGLDTTYVLTLRRPE